MAMTWRKFLMKLLFREKMELIYLKLQLVFKDVLPHLVIRKLSENLDLEDLPSQYYIFKVFVLKKFVCIFLFK